MRAKEFIIETIDPYTIFNQVKKIHHTFQDIEEGDLPDRIYWFDEYELTELPLSKINLDEFYVDEDLVEDYIDYIKDSPNTMPPIVYDPIANSVIDGTHRANAYARLGRKTIPAYVGKTKSSSYGEREEDLDEMALPSDWDPTMFGHDKSFKSRVEYAKQRAPKIGGGSSRVAFIIPDNGRDTVLKVAKNNKGIAQNEAEVDILTDGYVGKMDIVIPLIDYDRENPQPTWLQTELAQKASEKKLCELMKCGKYLFHLVSYANHLIGNKDTWALQRSKEHIETLSPEDKEIFMNYANQLADLVSSTPLQMGDFDRAANWGIYNGKPVVIDLGYTDTVAKLYWG